MHGDDENEGEEHGRDDCGELLDGQHRDQHACDGKQEHQATREPRTLFRNAIGTGHTLTLHVRASVRVLRGE
jgi:hypothetical protein